RIEYVRLLKVLKVCERRLDTGCVQCVLTGQAIGPLSRERGVQRFGLACGEAILGILAPGGLDLVKVRVVVTHFGGAPCVCGGSGQRPWASMMAANHASSPNMAAPSL